MKPKRLAKLLGLNLVWLFFSACYDSQHPLSAPQGSEPDARLEGLWKSADPDHQEMGFIHIGNVGEKGSDKRAQYAIVISHKKTDELDRPDEYYFFPSTIGKHKYLNVVECKRENNQCAEIREKGIARTKVEKYYLIRYEIKGESLKFRAMDGEAMKAVIHAGKLTGDESGPTFTDTTENLARFFAKEGDRLFSTKTANVIALKRVK